jgi:Protein of unknown function (DUF3108)
MAFISRRQIFAAIVVLALADAIVATGAHRASAETASSSHVRRVQAPIALPANVQKMVFPYSPGPIPFHDGEQLVFQASWVGIPVAQARFELHKKISKPAGGDPPSGDAAQWLAEAWVRTNPFADIFYRMRDYVRENIAADTLRTGGVYIVQHENKRFNTYDVKIDRQDGLVTASKKNHKGTQTKRFISSDPWGPLSGAMMALTQPLAAGKTYVFDVFTGGQRYVFSFVVDRRERIGTPLGDFDAWRVVPDIVYMSDGRLRGEARGTILWISADERHLPLRIQSQAFIGYVRADLVNIDGHGIAVR